MDAETNICTLRINLYLPVFPHLKLRPLFPSRGAVVINDVQTFAALLSILYYPIRERAAKQQVSERTGENVLLKYYTKYAKR